MANTNMVVRIVNVIRKLANRTKLAKQQLHEINNSMGYSLVVGVILLTANPMD